MWQKGKKQLVVDWNSDCIFHSFPPSSTVFHKILQVICWFAIMVAIMMNYDAIGQCWLVLVFYHLFLSFHLALQNISDSVTFSNVGNGTTSARNQHVCGLGSLQLHTLQSSFACSSFTYQSTISVVPARFGGVTSVI